MFGVLVVLVWTAALCSASDKPHFHNGVLPSYSGKPILMDFTADQLSTLDKDQPVVTKEMIGKSGRGIVIQDIKAATTVCMNKIRDLANYPKMVPHLKVCDVYDTQQFTNGTSKTKAKFVLGMWGLSMPYYVHMTHEPKYDTVTWTLDYSKLSTMDDSVGHWQVMSHPSKSGWSRVLYSTQAKLMPWIPEPVVQFISKKALTEATGWLKREAELEQGKQDKLLQEQKEKETTASSASTASAAVSTSNKEVSKGGAFGWFRGGQANKQKLNHEGYGNVIKKFGGLVSSRFNKMTK